MVIARTWRTQISALTLFVLIASTSHLGAQGETTQVELVAHASSNQPSATENQSGGDGKEIKWEQLRASLVSELRARVVEPSKELDVWYEDDGPLMAVLYLKCLGKTEERHGLLRLPWHERKTWTIGLFKLGNEKYQIVKAEESVEWRAPAGDWRIQNAPSRDVQASLIGQVFTGKPKP